MTSYDLTLNVNEIFGPTIQGEGPTSGQPVMFLRLFGCHLSCWWCDTPYTWATTEKRAALHRDNTVYDIERERHEMTGVDLRRALIPKLNEMVRPRLVVSGGEPLLQADHLMRLLELLKASVPRLQVEIETSATFEPPAEMVAQDWIFFNTSPKLKSSQNRKAARYKTGVLRSFRKLAFDKRAVFKFVIGSNADFDEMIEWMYENDLQPWMIWAMPMGTSDQELWNSGKLFVNEIIPLGINFSPRLQIDIWGNQRGV